MSIPLPDEVITLLNSKTSIKTLGTVSAEGTPHLAVKGSLHVNEQGEIIVLELLETSQTNKNLTYSLWFHKKVVVGVYADEDHNYLVEAEPYKVLIHGAEFEEYYRSVRETIPESDLSGVWILHPTSWRDETYNARLKEETDKHPNIGHLDRDLKF